MPGPASRPTKYTVTTFEGIEAVARIIGKQAPLPSALLDAHAIEQQAGDGVLGPSDFEFFCVLTVAPADLDAWRAALPPLQSPSLPPQYDAPKQALPWWLAPDDFPHLELYSPKWIDGRNLGWVGIDPESSRIFVYTFTM